MKHAVLLTGPGRNGLGDTPAPLIDAHQIHSHWLPRLRRRVWVVCADNRHVYSDTRSQPVSEPLPAAKSGEASVRHPGDLKLPFVTVAACIDAQAIACRRTAPAIYPTSVISFMVLPPFAHGGIVSWGAIHSKLRNVILMLNLRPQL